MARDSWQSRAGWRCPAEKSEQGLSISQTSARFPAARNPGSCQGQGHLRLNLVGPWHSEISKGKGLKNSGWFMRFCRSGNPSVPEFKDLVQFLHAGDTTDRACVRKGHSPGGGGGEGGGQRARKSGGFLGTRLVLNFSL